MCQNSSCGCSSQSKEKCVPKEYSDNVIYNGDAFACSGLAAIKPNCTNLSSLLKIFGDKICAFVNGHTIQDEGTPLTERSIINFIGTGVEAVDNPGTQSTDVIINTYTPSVKVNEYNEASLITDLGQDASFQPLTYFVPSGYESLSFTNSSGVEKDYIVHANYDYSSIRLDTDSVPICWIEAALFTIKGGPIETNEWEHKGLNSINFELYDGLTQDDGVYLPPAGSGVYEVRAINSLMIYNGNLMKKITLLDGESIEMRFKTKSADAGIQNLNKAQMFVQEL